MIEAIAGYLRESNANLGGAFGASRRSDELVERAHETAAAFLGSGSQKELDFGIGKYHRTDVPTFENDSPFSTEFALTPHHGLTHRRASGDPGGQQADFWGTDRLGDIFAIQKNPLPPIVHPQKVNGKLRGQASERFVVLRVDLQSTGGKSHGTIHGTGVEIDVPQAPGQQFAQCTLAGSRGAIDGDNQLPHQTSSP